MITNQNVLLKITQNGSEREETDSRRGGQGNSEEDQHYVLA